jgi:hypothetical protein
MYANNFKQEKNMNKFCTFAFNKYPFDMYKNLLTIIIAILFTSCSKYSHDIEKSLRLAGDNRSALEQVLNHYSQHPEDSLKYKAACFLIENMPGHYQIKGHEHFYDFMDSLNRSDLHIKEVNAKCDSLTEEMPNTSTTVLWASHAFPCNRFRYLNCFISPLFYYLRIFRTITTTNQQQTECKICKIFHAMVTDYIL